MTSWFERGRPALFEALKNACNQIDQDLRAELLEKEKGRVGSKSPEPFNRTSLERRVAELENENDRLRTRISEKSMSTMSVSSTAPLPHSINSTSHGAAHAEDGNDCKTGCAALQIKLDALGRNFKIAQESLQSIKDEREQWMQYKEKLEEKIKTAETEHRIHILSPIRRQSPAAPLPVTKANSLLRFPTSTLSADDKTYGFTEELPQLTFASPRKAYHPVGDDPDSTEDEAEDRVLEELPPLTQIELVPSVSVKQEPSSDMPCVVSERTVRKRKGQGALPGEAPARRVKIESVDNSSPIVSSEVCCTQESIDLDDVGQRMMTPRKRKELEISQIYNDESADGALLRTPAARLFRPDKVPQTTLPAYKSSALTPMSTNIPMARSVGYKLNTKRPMKDKLGYAISRLAEDGVSYDKRNMPSVKPQALHDASPSLKGRLDTLLNNPVYSSEASVTRPKQSWKNINESIVPERRDLPFGQSVRQYSKLQSLQNAAMPESRTPLQKSPSRHTSPRRTHKHTPSLLRSKRMSELRMEDFKVNPLANEGHDFAFSEVVRNKDERACLPGCTDIHCCGKQFRSLALSQRPNPPLTAAQRQEEQKLLEDYLGDYSYRLATMNKEQRMELWVEAKTQELANKYGKHRHRFSRMRSPPGFWNADFPSTQELEADRAEAGKRERQTISDRYREAMRPGGRWIFQDE